MVSGLMVQDIVIFICEEQHSEKCEFFENETFSILIIFIAFAPMTMVLTWQKITLFGYISFVSVFAVVAMIIGVAIDSTIQFGGPATVSIPTR